MTRLQRIPKVGDTFEFEGRKYSVKQMEGRRVELVKIENKTLDDRR
jgi:CBS domain containing-hemolysin-like protein